VAADVEAPAVALDGAADAADDVVRLEDGGGDAVAGGEDVGGGQTGGARTNDNDLLLRHEAWIYTFLQQVLQAHVDTKCVFSSNRVSVRGFVLTTCTRQTPRGPDYQGGE